MPTRIEPGDQALFNAGSASTQYHFAVTPLDPGAVIGVWQGAVSHNKNGVARNKPGVPYVDHVCGTGPFTVTVDNQKTPYVLTITANSWWKKVFGW